ncbi:WD40 domain-containing protein [Ordospora colligata]|nr:WD40 domain-containing protein [Ordospora colligata]
MDGLETDKITKKVKKDSHKQAKAQRNPFGDASEIGAFNGPWRGFVGMHESRNTPRYAREEQCLKKIVNKHCLVQGMERSRSMYALSINDPALIRTPMSKFVIPNRNTALFNEHKDTVTSCVLLKKHKLLVSSSLDGKVHLYNLRNNELVKTYMGHSKAVSSVVLDPDESRFTTVSFDGFLKRWQVENGRCDSVIDLSVPLTCQANQSSGNLLLAAGLDGGVRTLDMRSKTVENQINVHDENIQNDRFNQFSISDLALDEQRNTLLAITRNGQLHQIDLRNYKYFRIHSGEYSFIEFDSSRGMFLVACSNYIDIFNAQSGLSCVEKTSKQDCISTDVQEAQQMRIPITNRCSTVPKASEDGTFICYGSEDGFINFVECTSHQITSIGVRGDPCTSIDWIDGSISNLASGNLLGNVQIWE